MGIIFNALASLFVGSINNRRNNVRRHLVDSIDTGHLIMCGGIDTRVDRRGAEILNISGEVKQNACLEALYQANERNQTAAFFNNIGCRANIKISTNEQNCLILGDNASYEPLAYMPSQINANHMIEFFKRVIKGYLGRQNTDNDFVVLSGIIEMIISILKYKGNEYISIPNIDAVSSDLFNNDAMAFTKETEKKIGIKFPREWVNYLILNWDVASTSYSRFWTNFMSSINKYKCKTSKRIESLYSVLSGNTKNKIVVCNLLPEDNLLKSILLSEMETIYSYIPPFSLVDYHVPLPVNMNYSFLSNVNYCLVGNSLRELGLSGNVSFHNPEFVCLGVNASDANDIMNLLVSTGRWTRVNVGLEGIRPMRGGGVSFLPAEIQPITQSNLSFSKIHDGSALKINDTGYVFISNIIV